MIHPSKFLKKVELNTYLENTCVLICLKAETIIQKSVKTKLQDVQVNIFIQLPDKIRSEPKTVK